MVLTSGQLCWMLQIYCDHKLKSNENWDESVQNLNVQKNVSIKNENMNMHWKIFNNAYTSLNLFNKTDYKQCF